MNYEKLFDKILCLVLWGIVAISVGRGFRHYTQGDISRASFWIEFAMLTFLMEWKRKDHEER